MDAPNVGWDWMSKLLALGAGCVMALQPAVNARLATQCGHTLQASIISFGTGFIALCLVGMAMKVGFPNLEKLQVLPYWAWTGGLLGTYMVTVSLLIAPQLGATRWFVLVLTGQIMLALILDHFGWMGYAQSRLTPIRLLGILLFVVGACLVLMPVKSMKS